MSTEEIYIVSVKTEGGKLLALGTIKKDSHYLCWQHFPSWNLSWLADADSLKFETLPGSGICQCAWVSSSPTESSQ